MSDRIVVIVLGFALILVACMAGSYFLAPVAQTTAVYAIDTAVTQANRPLSPTEALAQNTARVNGDTGTPWGLVAFLLFGLVFFGAAAVFLNYGEKFLKQGRLLSKSLKPKKPKPLRVAPQTRALTTTVREPIIEGEVWND